jgi:hypothetical protein
MKMLKLRDGCVVAADQIEEVSVKTQGGLVVRMKSGIGHHVDADFRRSEYDTLTRLTEEINAALRERKS